MKKNDSIVTINGKKITRSQNVWLWVLNFMFNAVGTGDKVDTWSYRGRHIKPKKKPKKKRIRRR